MTSFRDWSRTTLAAGLLLWGGCGDGLQLIREGNQAGVVRYMYKGKDGHVVTPLRAEAFEKSDDFCGGPYQVIIEGETRGRRRVVEGLGGSEVLVEKWWGIRFKCKEKPLEK